MSEEKQEVLPKPEDLIKKLKKFLEGMSENPQTPNPSTGKRSDVENGLIDNVDQENLKKCIEKCKVTGKNKKWRLWDHHLGSPGDDYIGLVTLTWECDCCYVYNVKARHDTQLMDPTNIMVDLDIETTPQKPGKMRKPGECVPCKPVGMDVTIHLTLYRRFSHGTGEIQIWPTIARSFTIKVSLPPCGDAVDNTDYENQTHSGDWDKKNNRVKSEKEWGLKQL